MDKIKVAAVSYLNTKPLLYGIRHSSELMNRIELLEDYPSKIAAMLIDGTVDIGLVPVAILPELKESFIVSDYCIGAEAAVESVCLFSEVPVEKIETVLLDYQSRTSVNLCKILLKHYWKISPKIENAREGYRESIKGTTAGVVIGDRALEQKHISTYSYDLAAAWNSMTGLPFVFAAWIANKPLPQDFIQLFNEANKLGLDNIDKVIEEHHAFHYDLETYFSKNISFELTNEKRKGLDLFLQMLKDNKLVSTNCSMQLV